MPPREQRVVGLVEVQVPENPVTPFTKNKFLTSKLENIAESLDELVRPQPPTVTEFAALILLYLPPIITESYVLSLITFL